MPIGNSFHLSIATVIAAVVLHNPPQSAPLQGAWRIVRTSLTAGDQPSFRDYTQPGLILFTARH